MSVIIDNESGRIVGAFTDKRDNANKDRPRKEKKKRKRERAHLPNVANVSPQAVNDLETTLGAVRAIFDTADHVARILKGR